MNDDLNLLVTFYSTSKEMVKTVLKVEHGMNLEEWKEWRYFRLSDIEKLIMGAMPLHVRSFCDRILDMEDIFNVHYVDVKEKQEVKEVLLSNGEIVQLMEISASGLETWHVFNDDKKKYFYSEVEDVWADMDGNVLVGIKVEKELK